MKRFHILNTLFNLTGELCPPTQNTRPPPVLGCCPPPPFTAPSHGRDPPLRLSGGLLLQLPPIRQVSRMWGGLCSVRGGSGGPPAVQCLHHLFFCPFLAATPATGTGTSSCPSAACSRTCVRPWTKCTSRWGCGRRWGDPVAPAGLGGAPTLCHHLTTHRPPTPPQGCLKEKTLENVEKYVVKDVSVCEPPSTPPDPPQSPCAPPVPVCPPPLSLCPHSPVCRCC